VLPRAGEALHSVTHRRQATGAHREAGAGDRGRGRRRRLNACGPLAAGGKSLQSAAWIQARLAGGLGRSSAVRRPDLQAREPDRTAARLGGPEERDNTLADLECAVGKPWGGLLERHAVLTLALDREPETVPVQSGPIVLGVPQKHLDLVAIGCELTTRHANEAKRLRAVAFPAYGRSIVLRNGISADEVTPTFDSKTPGCTGEARSGTGRHAYCTPCRVARGPMGRRSRRSPRPFAPPQGEADRPVRDAGARIARRSAQSRPRR
jgi:hypothetical protein